jgi:hypothetical protein
LSNKNTVTFKFATAYDKPQEIADSLVSGILILGLAYICHIISKL